MGTQGVMRRAWGYITNVITSRAELMAGIDTGNRDLDNECHYPRVITTQNYRDLYDRVGIAKRVISIYPEECWALDPEILEDDQQTYTAFEQAWLDLDEAVQIHHYMGRVDEMSGIGHFGLLLLGFDDGYELSEPLPGIEEGKPAGHKLLYCRAFDETTVDIASYETDNTSPRYSLPLTYNVRFIDPLNDQPGGIGQDSTTKTIHWTRVIHVADNRGSSEVFGTPRLRWVYNNILDIRKTLGGSAEMFWKGGFPGYAFEVNPDMGDGVIDQEAMKAEFERYSNSLQRYIAITGVTAKPLAPQVASPEYHLRVQLEAVCIAIGVPMRIFLGSEEAKIASTQDSKSWNKRLGRRQHKYLSPWLVRPLVDRLIAAGTLPKPSQYRVVWPDLNTPTDEDRANVAYKMTDALSKYVAGGVDQVIAPLEFLVYVLNIPATTARMILAASEERVGSEDTFADLEIDRQPVPVVVKPTPGGKAPPRPARRAS